jgi:hypothetical protein
MAPSSQLLPASSGAESHAALMRPGLHSLHNPASFHHADGPPDPEQAEHEQHIAALVELGKVLMAANYDWVCPSPTTQTLVNSRFVNRKARDLAGVFGWNRPAEPELLSPTIAPVLLQNLVEAGVLQR